MMACARVCCGWDEQKNRFVIKGMRMFMYSGCRRVVAREQHVRVVFVIGWIIP